ncbi:unnamed protein product [Closterium sp. NIES-53]
MAMKVSPARSPKNIAVGWVLLAVLLSSVALAEVLHHGHPHSRQHHLKLVPVQPGDQLLFKWLGEHDVWQFPAKIAYDNCDFTLATQLYPKTGIFGAHYFYPVKNIQKGTTLYFGCAVGNHCARKMKAKVVVS